MERFTAIPRVFEDLIESRATLIRFVNSMFSAKISLLASFVTLLPVTGVTLAQGLPMTDAERQQQRSVQEGERAARAIPPLPIPLALSANGIEQIPRTTMLGGSSSYKDGGLAPAAGPKTYCLMKVFKEVAWRICVTDMGLKALWVGPVDLRPTPTSPWVRVLYQAGLADIFVPYHRGTPATRLYDLHFTTALDPVTSQDMGSNGSLITLSGESVPTVVAEVRDRGVAWLCKEKTAATRRGEELILWGVSDAGNYDNIVQYGFRDDGVITFRMGNTGFNEPSRAGEAHMHTGLWRVDVDLNGPGGDSAFLLAHKEPSSFLNLLKATDQKTPFTVEGRRPWIASEFTSLLIEDTATNTFGNRPGYEFVLMQPGTSRHYGPMESWTHNDFYVTVYNPNNLGWVTTWNFPDNYLLPDLNGGSTNNNDLVVWVKASAHHDPTDEDRSVNDRITGGITGVTPVHWSGFNMEPHNLFETNPLGGPVRCDVPPPCSPLTC